MRNHDVCNRLHVCVHLSMCTHIHVQVYIAYSVCTVLCVYTVHVHVNVCSQSTFKSTAYLCIIIS